jgi:DNA-binding XRE family transcriptional regulator
LDFATWFTQRRRETKMTLRDLAKKSGLSLPYVAALERGTSEAPPLKTCKALGRALGIGWEEVWKHSFAARLRKWLERQGYSRVPPEVVAEISMRIEESNARSR